jgi:hypothetical protein
VRSRAAFVWLLERIRGCGTQLLRVVETSTILPHAEERGQPATGSSEAHCEIRRDSDAV